MTVVAQYAALERIRIRADLEHVNIVIGFQQHKVAPCGEGKEPLVKAAYVRHYGHMLAAAAQREAYAFRRVVRSWEREHIKLLYKKVASCNEHAGHAVAQLAYYGRHGAERAFVCVNGNMVTSAEYAHALCMVAVVMGNEYGVYRIERNADFRHGFSRGAARKAAVYQYARAAAFGKEHIAGGAAVHRAETERAFDIFAHNSNTIPNTAANAIK